MTSPDRETQEIWSRARRVLRQQLESLRGSGVAQLPKPPVMTERPLAEVPAEPDLRAAGPPEPPRPAALERSIEPVAPMPSVIAPPPEYSAAAAREQPPCRATALDMIRREVIHCTRCAQLASTRTQTVFGVGNPEARLCLVGEAPGADEDRKGEPFVGPAGQLLNKILAAMSLRREDVYILNVLKCRPPQNRAPLPEESANCRSFLERQLEIIRPEFICCLGATAAQALLRTTLPLGRLRGRFHDYQGIRVLATYHPAYLLRQPEMKRETWEDMKLLMQAMGLEPPAK